MKRILHIPIFFVIILAGGAPLFGQRPARLELFAGYSYSSVGATERHSFNGAQGHIKLNFNPTIGLVLDAGGQYRSDPAFTPPPDLSFLNFHDRYLHVYQALVGPEFTRRGPRVDLFGHTLAGVFHGGVRNQAQNFFALGLGGGVDVHKDRGPSLRIQADYIPDHGGGVWFHDFRLGVGVVFKIIQ
jgi:hypothetical protein